MADDVIDLTAYLWGEGEHEVPRGAMSLWGADGQRSRFALPLWRIVYLAGAERGIILWKPVGSPEAAPVPFVAMDLVAEPARVDLGFALPDFGPEEAPRLIDRLSDGVIVFLGVRAGRAWSLVADGGEGRRAPLVGRAREDILFLAGECAGLLFLRDLAADESAIEED